MPFLVMTTTMTMIIMDNEGHEVEERDLVS